MGTAELDWLVEVEVEGQCTTCEYGSLSCRKEPCAACIAANRLTRKNPNLTSFGRSAKWRPTMSKTESEKLKGRAYLGKQLLLHAPKLHELLEQGYSEEQFYNAFPKDALKNIGMDLKSFTGKLRTIVNRYRKTIHQEGTLVT